MANRFYRTNFIFVANRYEEWQAGRCISQGSISTKIVAEVSGNTIHFELDDIGKIRMLKSFDFDIYGEDYCVLPDRIQYSHGTSDFNPIVPMVCNVFYNGSTMKYVRFAMTNPDRLVEFYGTLTQYGQPSTGRRTETKADFSITAEKTIQELSSYGMLNAGAIMERAVKLYNDNANVASLEQAKSIIESLKLFVKTLELDQQENDDETSLLTPKILMFIALCNYKIGNINEAYCIAKQGMDAIDEAEKNSPFIGIPKSMLGADTLEELIKEIETNRFDFVEDADDYYAIDPSEIDTTRFKSLIGWLSSDATSEEYIYSVLKRYDGLRNQLMKWYFQGNQQALIMVMMLHEFTCPIFYAWEYYGYGYISDFWKEDAAIEAYKHFKSLNVLDEIRKTYHTITTDIFPFSSVDKDGSLKDSTIAILKALLERMNSRIDYDDLPF